MNFGAQIKKLRLEQNLTQENFAEKLHVSRQAVSNWENDKNLPDIEMLLRISDEFQISLDLLIRGEEKRNNMTEKIIQDGSENKRAKYRVTAYMVGIGFFLLGVICILIKGFTGEYLDEQGFLHEYFFLLPIGFLSMFIGILVIIVEWIMNFIRRRKAK